jgi:Glycosyl transferase family 11
MNDSKKRFLVQPRLPKAGLGNILLVWARAVLFAEINSLPISAPNWQKFQLGPYIRGERDKRAYSKLFYSQKYVSKFNWALVNLLRKEQQYYNPEPVPINFNSFSESSSHLFIFSSVPHWSDYFKYLKDHRDLIRQKLLADIRVSVLQEIEARSAPDIGIHLRMGDFKTLQPGEDFSQVGNTRTPIEWFVSVINCIRSHLGFNIPVTIFSDGQDIELESLLSLPLVLRSSRDSAVSDLLTLAKSRVLIASSGSTFSNWASYLGQCPTIYHPAHFHSGVFPESLSEKVFEGGFDPDSMDMPDLLLSNIRNLFH